MVSEGWCIWITGLPKSGKTSVARALRELAREKGIDVEVLSSDDLRAVLTPDATYSQRERQIVYDALVYVAQLLTRNDVNVVIDATGNRRTFRDAARSSIGRFSEVWLRCPLEVCVEREREDSDGESVYALAESGESETVPGVGVEYEEPLDPELTLDCEEGDPRDKATRVLEELVL